MYPCLGNIHIHSTYSDGHACIPEIAAAAKKAGLRFIIVTDHNTVAGLADEGYHDGVLVLCGSEINTERHHYLALGIRENVPQNDGHPQAVIDHVNDQGGLGFIAHPFEKGSPLILQGKHYPWTDWNITDFAGIEVWNWCSQWRDGVRNILSGLYYAYIHPTGPIKGPDQESLSRFDKISLTRPLTAIAGTDAHNYPLRYGPLRRNIFPYLYLFQTACNRLLLDEPLSADVTVAKSQIYSALRRGRNCIVNRLAGDPEGFTYTAAANGKDYYPGDSLPWNEMAVLNISCPYRYRGRLRIRIIRNGVLSREINRCNVAIRAQTPGNYRLEVYLGRKPWIFTNQIYIA